MKLSNQINVGHNKMNMNRNEAISSSNQCVLEYWFGEKFKNMYIKLWSLLECEWKIFVLVKGLPFFLINTFHLATNFCVNINSPTESRMAISSSAFETFLEQTLICHLMWKFAENFIIYSKHSKHMIWRRAFVNFSNGNLWWCWWCSHPSHVQCQMYNNKFFIRDMPININLLLDDTSKWALFDGKVLEKNSLHVMQLWSQEKKGRQSERVSEKEMRTDVCMSATKKVFF